MINTERNADEIETMLYDHGLKFAFSLEKAELSSKVSLWKIFFFN